MDIIEKKNYLKIKNLFIASEFNTKWKRFFQHCWFSTTQFKVVVFLMNFILWLFFFIHFFLFVLIHFITVPFFTRKLCLYHARMVNGIYMILKIFLYQFFFRFLPSHCSIVERFRSKAFCGTYSHDGSVFMSACQGDDSKYFRCIVT